MMTVYGKGLTVLRCKQPLDALAELVRAAKGKRRCALHECMLWVTAQYVTTGTRKGLQCWDMRRNP